VVGGGGVVVTGGAVVDGGSVVVVGGMMVVVVVVRGMVVVVGGSVVVVRGMVVVVGGSVVVGRGAVVVGDSVVVGRGMVVVGGGVVVVGGRGVVVTVGKVLGLIELVGTGSGPPPAALTGSPSSTKVDARMPLTSTAVMMLSRFMSGVLGARGLAVRSHPPPRTRWSFRFAETEDFRISADASLRHALGRLGRGRQRRVKTMAGAG
jgi:hypothetical protein